MKAAVMSAFGPPSVVGLQDVPVPVPRRGEVLVRVVATTVSSADWRIRSATFPRGFSLPARLIFGFRRPRRPVLGTELAGVVTATGPGVTRFRPGDAVIAHTGARLGAHAEFARFPETGAIVAKPPSLDWAEAASLSFGGLTALHAIQTLGRVGAGTRVLVTGASGAVGSAAVQMAHALGAEVTGLCSAANADLVRGLGAAKTIDYRAGPALAPGRTWDVICDTVGVLNWDEAIQALAPGGRLVAVVPTLAQALGAAIRARRRGRQVLTVMTPETRSAMERLAALTQAGAFRPVVGAVFPFERIAQAHDLAGSGHKRGSAVVMLGDPP